MRFDIARITERRGRTLLVPWHGETLLDLDQAIELDRKLPARTSAVRRVVMTWNKAHRDELIARGLERLMTLHVSDSGKVSPTYWNVCQPSTQASGQELIGRLVEEIEKGPSSRCGGYGSRG